jgi:antitoxin component YwqK of YwqJK toxin-antitoxin module
VGGKREGEAVVYNGGVLSSRLSYRADRLHGRCVWYGPEGAVLKVSEFAAGREEGATLAYFADGTVQERSTYRAGLLDGESLSYYPSGALRRRLFYRAGRPEGDPREFDESGRPLGQNDAGGPGWLGRMMGRS